MGRQDLPFELGKDVTLRFPPQLLVAVSHCHLEALQTDIEPDAKERVHFEAVSPSEPVSEEALKTASFLVVEVDPSVPESLDRLSNIRSRHPALPVIVALAGADVALVRSLVKQGVADVVSLPFDTEELLQACISAAESRMAPAAPPGDLAPVVAVIRATGGSGASTIATHLADEMGRRALGARGACLIDLDVQLGSIAPLLGLAPRRTLEDLLASGERLDGDFLRSVAAAHSKHLDVIAAPEEIIPLESIDTDQLLRIIEVARNEYGCVLLDLPANWTSWNLSAVLGSDLVLMVVSLDIPSLRQAKRQLNLFATAGIDIEKVSIVVNRVEKRLFRMIGFDDVEEALKRPVIAGVREASQILSSAQNEGLLASGVKRKGPFVSDLSELADEIAKRFKIGERA